MKRILIITLLLITLTSVAFLYFDILPYSNTPEVTPNANSDLNKNEYIFLEQHSNVDGVPIDKDCNIALMIDFPTYYFNSEEGTLTDYAKNLEVNENLKIAYGSGGSRSGAAGGGVATTLIGIYELPYVKNEIRINKITKEGTVDINYKGNNLLLKAGEVWTNETTTISSGIDDCKVKVTTTDTIKNYGIYSKEKINISVLSPPDAISDEPRNTGTYEGVPIYP